MSDNDIPLYELGEDGNEKPQVQKPKRHYTPRGQKQKKQRDTPDAKKIKILEFAAKDVPHSDISRALGVPVSTVSLIIQRFGKVFKALDRVQDYRSAKSDILAAGQIAALESAFSGKKLERAGFLGTLKGYEILNKAERLDSNLSTENHQHIGKFQMIGMGEEG